MMNIQGQYPFVMNKEILKTDKMQLFRRFGIVSIRDPKNPNTAHQLITERVNDHICKCEEKQLPVTHPVIGAPLDSAEIAYIKFHYWCLQNSNSLPKEAELELNYSKLCNRDVDSELLVFARTWLDISFFIGDKQEMDFDFQSLLQRDDNQFCHSYFELEKLGELKDAQIQKKRKIEDRGEARYERSCYHQLLSNEKAGTLVFRPSSLNRRKKSDIFDYYVLTVKTGENAYVDQLIVYERGRGWCATGAKANSDNEISLHPNRCYFPAFFDILVKVLSKLSLEFSDIKRYSASEIESIYLEFLKNKQQTKVQLN